MRTKSEYFVLTLPLKTEKWQADILDRRMRVNREIYNALLKKAYGRYRQMTQTREWRRIEEGLRECRQTGTSVTDWIDKRNRMETDLSDSGHVRGRGHLNLDTPAAGRKELYRRRVALVAQYRLRKYDLTKDAAKYRQSFPENTDSPICQNLAEQVWRAIDRLATGRGQQVHFKGPDGLNDLSGKTNRSSIMYRNGYVRWKGLLLKAISKDNAYEREALQHEIRYCRIKRREIRGKFRYYVDLVMEGCAPLKHPESLGVSGDVIVQFEADRRKQGFLVRAERFTVNEASPVTGDDLSGMHLYKNVAPEERTALERDVSRRSILYSGDLTNRPDHKSRIHKLSPDTITDRRLEREKQKILRFLYRSRKAMNPQNYTEDGRIRAGAFEWHYSKHYRQERARYRELCRKQTERRRQYQNRLADKLLACGNCFYIEEIDFSEKKRRLAQNGPGRKKRYGKRIAYSAPGSFARVLKRKCVQYQKEYQGYQRYQAENAGELLLAVSGA